MAAFEVTTDTDSITVTWTADDDSKFVNFTISLDYVVQYTGGSGYRSPYRMQGLTAGTTHTVQIQAYTTTGNTDTPIGARYTLSMLSSNE